LAQTIESIDPTVNGLLGAIAIGVVSLVKEFVLPVALEGPFQSCKHSFRPHDAEPRTKTSGCSPACATIWGENGVAGAVTLDVHDELPMPSPIADATRIALDNRLPTTFI
jgi:hypothetical protein